MLAVHLSPGCLLSRMCWVFLDLGCPGTEEFEEYGIYLLYVN